MSNAPIRQSGGWKKAFWLAAGGLIVAGLALSLWRTSPSKERTPAGTGSPAAPSNLIALSPEAQRNANLKLAEVEERPLQQTLTATGAIAPDQSRLLHIRPLARGVAETVLAKIGDRVRAGDSLLTYDNIELGELVGQYLAMQAEIEREQAQAEVAKSYLARAEALLAEEAIARKEHELRQAQYKQAVAVVESKQAALAQVEEKIHRVGWSDEDLRQLREPKGDTHRTASQNILRAPFAGVITRQDVAPGETMAPDREVFTLADTSVVWALADIYEKDLGQVAVGQPCQVRVPAYPGQAFPGKVTYLSDTLDPASRTAKLRCVVANPDGRLKLEMFAAVEIPLPTGRTTLAVPESAVQTVEGLSVVFVSKTPTQFEKRGVEPGERAGNWLEIRSGLRPGEKVVTEGAFYVKSALLREQISGGE